MPSARFQASLVLLILFTCLCSQTFADTAPETPDPTAHVLTVRPSDIQQCEPVQQLSALKAAIEEKASPVMRQVFAWLFPFGPAWNSGTTRFD
jgi:zinc transporter 7